MVGPRFIVNHGKLRDLEYTRDVLMAQERLLVDLRESVKPLERVFAERRGLDAFPQVHEEAFLSHKHGSGVLQGLEFSVVDGKPGPHHLDE